MDRNNYSTVESSSLTAQSIERLKDRFFQLNQMERLQNIKNRHMELVSYRNRAAADQQPTYREICESVLLLKEKMPHREINSLITYLYNVLIKGQNKTQDQLEFDPLKETGKSCNQKYYARVALRQRKISSRDQEYRFNQKLLVANAFVNRDYGIAALEAEMQQSNIDVHIHRKRYKNVACGVVTEGYRRLELFLKDQCKRSIKPLNRLEMRSLFTILCQARVNLSLENCLTFFKFIKIAFGMEATAITEPTAISLYISIQKLLKSRVGQMELDATYQKRRIKRQKVTQPRIEKTVFDIWTLELQRQFLQIYKECPHYIKIRDIFRKRYSTSQSVFTVESFRGKLYKILRLALRKVMYLFEKADSMCLPNLTKLNDHKIKIILRCPDALAVRIHLVNIYLADSCEVADLSSAIVAINAYLSRRHLQRQKQIIEAMPLASSAAEKIDHNVTVSRKRLKQRVKKYATDAMFIKNVEQNFQHIVSIQNGQSLHYYRKVKERPYTTEIDTVDRQRGTQIVKKEFEASGKDLPLTWKQREPSETVKKIEHISLKQAHRQELSDIELKIKVEMQKCMKQLYDRISGR